MNSLSLLISLLDTCHIETVLEYQGSENTWEANLRHAQEDQNVHLFQKSYSSTECSGTAPEESSASTIARSDLGVSKPSLLLFLFPLLKIIQMFITKIM